MSDQVFGRICALANAQSLLWAAVTEVACDPSEIDFKFRFAGHISTQFDALIKEAYEAKEGVRCTP